MKTTFLIIFLFTISVFSQSKNTINFNVAKDTAIKPDEMIVEISVNNDDSTTVAVNQISHSSLVEVLNVLRKYGYKDENIFLRESSLQNNYPNPRQSNYYSTQSYRIILNKFELFDQLKKDLLDAGATDIKIITFWSSKYKQLKKELYTIAIAESKEKAKFFGAQFGLKKIHILNITDNSREESVNPDLSFENNGVNALTPNLSLKFTGLGAPTITSEQLVIDVSMRVTYEFE
jgi:uncharacterized protein YggE